MSAATNVAVAKNKKKNKNEREKEIEYNKLWNKTNKKTSKANTALHPRIEVVLTFVLGGKISGVAKVVCRTKTKKRD